MSDDHQFDRRSSDVNVQSLATQVQALAGRVEVLEEQGRTTGRALTDNTTLTREVHEAVFGVEGEFPGVAKMGRDVHAAMFGEDGKPGVQQLVENLSDIIETGRSFFRWIGRMASGAGKASDFVSRNLRRFWWLIALALAVGTYLKTGKWELPVWPG